jgi:hypothetical protein
MHTSGTQKCNDDYQNMHPYGSCVMNVHQLCPLLGLWQAMVEVQPRTKVLQCASLITSPQAKPVGAIIGGYHSPPRKQWEPMHISDSRLMPIFHNLDSLQLAKNMHLSVTGEKLEQLTSTCQPYLADSFLQVIV